MRIAIVHYWLVGMRGGEKVVEALCRMYPEADIFTHVYDPSVVSRTISSHRVQTSFIARLPRATKSYKSYLPLMPMALEHLDLRGYDLVISSESGPSKGIIPPSGALHICYCHSPMRYIWNMFHDYRERTGPMTRMLMTPLSHYLRTWDAISATRVHDFVANSHTVAHRLHTYYRRDADVIHPPVDTDSFQRLPSAEVEDFYLMVGRVGPLQAARARSRSLQSNRAEARRHRRRRDACRTPRVGRSHRHGSGVAAVSPAPPSLLAVPRADFPWRRGFRHRSGGSHGER